MAALRTRVIIACTLLLAVVPGGLAAGMRGVPPELEFMYNPSASHFTCRDASKTIPFSQVNDGYCDCVDGSDEPGTPACPNGRFFCANLGFEGKTLNASFVDDGVCDCCDGADERPGACPNRCLAEGRAALAALQADVAARDKGIAARADYVADAMLLRKKWGARLAKIAEELPPKQVAAAAAAAELARLEKQLEAVEARKAAAEAAAKPADEPEQPTEQDAAAGAAADAAEEAQEEAPAAGEEAADEAVEAEESAEDLAKRVASQWIPEEGGEEDAPAEEEEAEEEYDPSAAADADGAGEPAAPASTLTPEEEEALLAEVRVGPVAAAKSWAAGLLAKVTGGLGDAGGVSRLTAAADVLRRRVASARAASTAADAAVDTLKAEADDLREREGRSYGPDDAFAKLADTCIDANIEKYVYRVCPFSNAEQLDGGRSTGLGTWAGFDEAGEHMVFSGGEGCWQGPARSMRVRLVCGAAEALSRVAEPSRCEYTAQLATPAACTETGLTEMRHKVMLKRFYLHKAEEAAGIPPPPPVHDEL